MKLVFPLPSFYPAQCGGPDNSIYWIANGLAEHGVKSSIITTEEGLSKEDNIPLDRWNSVFYGKVIYLSIKTFTFFKLLRIVNKELQSNEILILSSIFHPMSFFCYSIATLKGHKVIWSPRGELDTKALSYSKNRKKYLLFLIRKIICLNTKKLLLHGTCPEETNSIRNNLSKKHNVITIPNYMIIPKKIDHNPKADYLLYLGRLHDKKNIIALIESIIPNSNQHLIIAGDYNNSYGKKLRNIVAKKKLHNNIKFVGLIKGTKKQELLAQAKVLIMPSFTENFGNVVIEALAQGTPVIASKGSPWKILEEKKAGYWINPITSEIKESISKINSLNKNDYDLIRKNAYQLAIDSFDINKNINQWLSVLSKLDKKQ